jgi:hypothetical protein
LAARGSDLWAKLAAFLEAYEEHQEAARARGAASLADDIEIDQEDGGSIDEGTRLTRSLTRELERRYPVQPEQENLSVEEAVANVKQKRAGGFRPPSWERT